MPQIVNGIGTWYYGKRRIHSYKGTCEFCKRFADLESYDTTLFFVVFMVPIFPLGQKRILQQCSACHRHRYLSRKEWDAAKVRTSAEVLENLQNNPDDLNAIMKAIEFALSYQDEPLFDSLVEKLGVDRAKDAHVQARLGDGYSYFSRWPETEDAYRASLALEDKDIVREALAWSLLKQGRPDEAKPYLQHITVTKKGASVASLYFLVESYQSLGMHQEALDVMDESEDAFPELKTNKDYQRQRKTSNRYINSGKRIPSVILSTGKAGYREGGWTSRVPYLIALLLPLICLCIYLGSAFWIGQSRKVFLVNGTNKPYSVTVQGKEYKLNANSATPIHLSEGDVEVAFSDPKLGLEPLEIKVETNFWGRPFNSYTFVLNPDQAAIVMEDERYYSAVNPPAAGPAKFHFGKGFYSLPGADYQFEEFPPTLQAKKTDQLHKTRVSLSPFTTPDMRMLMLIGLEKSEQIKVCRRVVQIDPGNLVYLNWLTQQLPPEEAIAFLEPRLETKPIMVDWHRIYQNLMERAHPETDLMPRYRKLVADNPGQPDAIYLLGRADPNLDESMKLYMQAATADPPSLHAVSGLGFRALSEGRFDEASRYMSKAFRGFTDKTLVEHYYRETLLANKEYDTLLSDLQGDSLNLAKQYSAGVQMVRVYSLKGDKTSAQQKLSQIVFGGTPQQQLESRRMLEAAMAACSKDANGYINAMSTTPSFEVSFLRGDIGQAEKLIVSSPQNSLSYHGLLYLEGTRTKAKELADTHWSALLAELGKEGRDERLFGDLLAGRKSIASTPPARIHLEPEKKRVLLAVLAQRYPGSAKELLALAKKLDYQRDGVSLCLAKFLEKK